MITIDLDSLAEEIAWRVVEFLSHESPNEVERINHGALKMGTGSADMQKQDPDGCEHWDNRRFKCCICGREFSGYGYNPWPVKKSGECCRRCNDEIVIPERMEHARRNVNPCQGDESGKNKAFSQSQSDKKGDES